MSLQHSRDPWTKLSAAARQARDDRDDTAPYGFATRVAALALTQDRHGVSLVERFALRALGLACLLALGSVALNYNEISVPEPSTSVATAENLEPVTVAANDTVALVLDIAD